MKPSASRIERMLAKIEAKVAPPSRVRLSVMIDDTDDELAHLDLLHGSQTLSGSNLYEHLAGGNDPAIIGRPTGGHFQACPKK